MQNLVDQARKNALKMQRIACLYHQQSSDVVDHGRLERSEPRRSEVLEDAAQMKAGDAVVAAQAREMADTYRTLLEQHQRFAGAQLRLA